MKLSARNKLDGTGCGMSFCSNGTCSGGHCQITPINEGQTCDDGLYCTVGETCKSVLAADVYPVGSPQAASTVPALGR